MPRKPPPRAAATVMLLRDGSAGPEVLLLRRHTRSGFAGDMWVFPGGTVDDSDRQLPRERWGGIDLVALSGRFGEAPDLVLGLHVAAVRETFEEAGLLLARQGDGRPVEPQPQRWVPVRRLLADHGAPRGWAAWLAEGSMVLDLGCLTYHSRWVTPLQEPRRYDTAFFVARAPEGQIAAHDRVETTQHVWATPAGALGAFRRGELRLMYPTMKTLESLSVFASSADIIAAARAQREVASVRPHIEAGPQGARVVHPDESDYEELDRRARA